MFPHQPHRATPPCMPCNRANDDEPSRLIGQTCSLDNLERRHCSAARGTLFQTVFGITTRVPTYCYRSAFPNPAVDRSLERDWPTPVRIGAWMDTQKAERKSDIPMIHDP